MTTDQPATAARWWERLLAALMIRSETPCRGCGKRNLWSNAHGEWCLLRGTR